MPVDAPTYSILPLAAVLVSLLAVPAILLSGHRPNLREGWSLIAAVVKFVFVLQLLPLALNGERAGLVLLEIAPGLDLSLVADPLGVYFALVASGLWLVTSVYAIGYMRGHGEKKQTRFYAAFALSLSSTIGVAFAANLLTFVIFYEMLTLATYPLVIHKENREALRSGRMYLGYALTAGLLLLAAAAWIYARTGTLDFAPGGFIPQGAFSEGELVLLFGLLMVGVGVKAGIMPLHSWLPAAMVAPTPVSALLHAVAVVKSGAFGVLRVVGFVLGPALMAGHGLDVLLASFAAATILLASIIALRQDNLKRRLAYSTIAHLSYIVLGAALVVPGALLGSILHLSAHAVMKIVLFFCAGAIQVHAHRSEISTLNGLGRTMPWTFGAFALGSLGLAGIPPLYGFLSKWWLVVGSMEAGQVVVLWVFVLSGILNAAYFFPIVVRAFCLPAAEDDGDPVRSEASAWMVVPLCLAAVLAVVLGVFPNFPLAFFDLAKVIVESIIVTDTASPPTMIDRL